MAGDGGVRHGGQHGCPSEPLKVKRLLVADGAFIRPLPSLILPLAPRKRSGEAVRTARPVRRRPAPMAVSIRQGVCPAGTRHLHFIAAAGPANREELE